MIDRTPNYIERIALDVWTASNELEPWYPDDEASLWLGYAVLPLPVTAKKRKGAKAV